MHKIIPFIGLLLLLFTGCESETHPEEKQERTLIVYLARDVSDLSVLIEEKIDYILQGWNGQGGNIIIYEDKMNTNPILYQVVREGETNRAIEVNRYQEENSAAAPVFGRVLQEIRQEYPADSYGLIFFSHASGWLPENYFFSTRSLGKDGDSEMELTDFAAAIPNGMFDYIIFEACFMAGIEVVYELRNKTSYILGSSAEVLSPGFIYTYRDYINYLFSKEADLLSFTKQAFQRIDNMNGAYRSGTLSIIDTRNVNSLANWLRDNITEEFTGNLDEIQHFDRKETHLFYDFEDYFSYLITMDKQEKFRQLINDCILYKDATPHFFAGTGLNSFTINQHSGITTYIMKDELPELNEAYKKLQWYKAVF